MLKNKTSVRMRAWVISISLHLLVLIVFCFTRFSKANEGVYRPDQIPQTKVSRVRELSQTDTVRPKPKVKKFVRQKAENSGFKVPVKEILIERPAARSISVDKPKSDFRDLTSIEPAPNKVEFFGIWTDQLRVCYIVDCSGSMKGMFGHVRARLKNSILSLQPDQYFCIIFFGNDGLLEYSDGEFVRAAKYNKETAFDFIDSTKPSGKADAKMAIKRAIKICGSKPVVIYFLSDGFELTGEDTSVKDMEKLIKGFAPQIKINTIGFWPQDPDRLILSFMAERSGGNCIFVNDNR